MTDTSHASSYVNAHGYDLNKVIYMKKIRALSIVMGGASFSGSSAPCWSIIADRLGLDPNKKGETVGPTSCPVALDSDGRARMAPFSKLDGHHPRVLLAGRCHAGIDGERNGTIANGNGLPAFNHASDGNLTRFNRLFARLSCGSFYLILFAAAQVCFPPSVYCSDSLPMPLLGNYLGEWVLIIKSNLPKWLIALVIFCRLITPLFTDAKTMIKRLEDWITYAGTKTENGKEEDMVDAGVWPIRIRRKWRYYFIFIVLSVLYLLSNLIRRR